MSSILVLAFRLPYPLQDGGALRTYHLARQLRPQHRCHLAILSSEPLDRHASEQVVSAGAFVSVTRISLPAGRKSPLRHLRLSDETFWRWTYPRQFRASVHALQALVHRLDAKVVVATDLCLAEFAQALDGVQTVVDDCDCQWLTISRERDAAAPPSLGFRLQRYAKFERAKRQEGDLTSRFDLVTTVSPVDRAAIQSVSRHRRGAVRTVPNGVEPALTGWSDSAPEVPNAVAFWGNLDFPPNRIASLYFCKEVFLPYLEQHGIEAHIIGRNPSPELVRLSRTSPAIKVPGYVDDLFGLVARMPVIVNPMVCGSGLKNKVLEAFALRRAVVSTSLGMEGIAAADGKHYVRADDPASFAEAIIELLRDRFKRERLGGNARALVLDRYTWGTVGVEWNRMVRDVLEGRIA